MALLTLWEPDVRGALNTTPVKNRLEGRPLRRYIHRVAFQRVFVLFAGSTLLIVAFLPAVVRLVTSWTWTWSYDPVSATFGGIVALLLGLSIWNAVRFSNLLVLASKFTH